MSLDRLLILSPHLDDGVFSLGAAAARLVHLGYQVVALSVFAGHPCTAQPLSSWDQRCGFASAAEAVVERRREDARAWELLGVRASWLDLDADDSDGAVLDALAAWLRPNVLAFLPGYPLLHPDHRRLHRLALQVLRGHAVAEYVEQPYALQHALRGLPPLPGHRPLTPSGWMSIRVTSKDRSLKRRAIAAYASQLRAFSPLLSQRISAWERITGGERIRLTRPT